MKKGADNKITCLRGKNPDPYWQLDSGVVLEI